MLKKFFYAFHVSIYYIANKLFFWLILIQKDIEEVIIN